VVVGVFVLNALLILLLLTVVGIRDLYDLIRTRRASAAAAGLHLRIVGLFSIIADIAGDDLARSSRP
jgi:two-component system nitrogen regulation sensor histidine kinase NtrY